MLDIYCPAEAVAAQEGRGSAVPVVIAVMGGAWAVGYKAWNAQLGDRLMDAGILVFAIDYNNFPCARIPQMVADLDAGIAWVLQNARSYGGDATKIVLTGQSAGAHLGALLLLERCEAEAVIVGMPREFEAATSRVDAASADCDLEVAEGSSSHGQGAWSPRDLTGFVGVSGPYDLKLLGCRLEDRWIGAGLLDLICPGGRLECYSPTLRLQENVWQRSDSRASAFMPPVLLFHGDADKTVPPQSSLDFAMALQSVGATAVADIRAGLAHAEVIIEGPMRGEDYQVQLLLSSLFGAEEADARFQAMPSLRPLFPHWVIQLASWIMPF